MAARITTIAGEIATLIDGMTTAGGYNYNWSQLNEPDKAHQKTWPSAVVRYRKFSRADGIEALYGMYNAEIIITVENKITPSTTVKPEFTADAALDNCLADLTKLFGANSITGYFPLSKEAFISFVSAEKINTSRNDTYFPTKLETVWNVFFHNT
jgi:hypothetical protein